MTTSATSWGRRTRRSSRTRCCCCTTTTARSTLQCSGVFRPCGSLWSRRWAGWTPRASIPSSSTSSGPCTGSTWTNATQPSALAANGASTFSTWNGRGTLPSTTTSEILTSSLGGRIPSRTPCSTPAGKSPTSRPSPTTSTTSASSRQTRNKAALSSPCSATQTSHSSERTPSSILFFRETLFSIRTKSRDSTLSYPMHSNPRKPSTSILGCLSFNQPTRRATIWCPTFSPRCPQLTRSQTWTTWLQT